MRNYLVLLISKYCRLLSAANRLKCGKKVKGSILSTLNHLRASLARYDKAMRGECVKFKSPFITSSDVVEWERQGAWDTFPVTHIIRAI
jgi:hypothetical protein